jgi:hypothetical protein
LPLHSKKARDGLRVRSIGRAPYPDLLNTKVWSRSRNIYHHQQRRKESVHVRLRSEHPNFNLHSWPVFTTQGLNAFPVSLPTDRRGEWLAKDLVYRGGART